MDKSPTTHGAGNHGDWCPVPGWNGTDRQTGNSSQNWMTNRKDLMKERKLTKTAKMRKAILEEYQKGFPADPESSEEKATLE